MSVGVPVLYAFIVTDSQHSTSDWSEETIVPSKEFQFRSKLERTGNKNRKTVHTLSTLEKALWVEKNSV